MGLFSKLKEEFVDDLKFKHALRRSLSFDSLKTKGKSTDSLNFDDQKKELKQEDKKEKKTADNNTLGIGTLAVP